MDRRYQAENGATGMTPAGFRQGAAFMFIALALIPPALAADKMDPVTDKELSGMSIVGNNETPKALTIIPWRSAEVSKEPSLNPSSLNEKPDPVNRDVFSRELEFYRLTHQQ